MTNSNKNDENDDSEASAEDLDIDIDPGDEPTNADTHFAHTYHTLFGELCPEEVKLMASTLANKAFTHSACFHAATQGDKAHGEEVQDPFAYNVSTSRYTSTSVLNNSTQLNLSLRLS
jgi:hypothetical protein